MQDEPPNTETKTYVEQMDCIIDAVKKEETHLILEPAIVSNYGSSSKEAKQLFIRLFVRKHFWIRVSSFDEAKYPNAQEAVEELVQKGLLLRNQVPFDELLCMLKKHELLSLVQTSSKVPNVGRMNRQELINTLGSHPNPLLLLETVKAVLGCVVKQSLSARNQFQKLVIIYQRMEYWPEKEFLTDSILSNLSDDDSRKRTFVNYNVHRIGIIWGTIDEFEDYFAALKIEHTLASDRDCWETLVEKHVQLQDIWSDLILHSPEDGHFTGIKWFSTFTKANVYTRIFSSLFYPAYFRLKRHSEAIDLLKKLLKQRTYLATKRGYWYDELARLTENYVSKADAKLICKQGLSDTMVVTHHRSSLYKRLAAISKVDGKTPIQLRDRISNLKMHNTRHLKAQQTLSEKNHVMVRSCLDGSSVRVEIFVLEYFQSRGWKGYHAENSIITTLFALLFFDILFDDTVPGVFAHPFQTYPLDMYTVFFFETRRESIQKRLEEIRQGSAPDIMEKVCAREREKRTRCIGLNWGFSTGEVCEIAACVGPSALATICEAFAKQYWSHRGGVPDLCLWKIESLEFKLVEVKSTNDKLSEKQIVWLDFLAGVKVDTEVVQISDCVKRVKSD